MITIKLPDESATIVLAGIVAEFVKPGMVIALCGEMGSGKTTFTRGLASRLGVPEELVNSPTYLLQQDYLTPTGMILHHFDVYRLDDPEQFEMLGVGETFDSNGISIVEWADRAPDSIPTDAWWFFFSHDSFGTGRILNINMPEMIVRKIQAAFHVI